MLKLAKIISGHSNKKKKEDISALHKSADTFKDYSATSIVDKIDQIDHTNSSTLNQIDATSTDNTSNVESSTSAEDDPVWSTIEWNIQSSGIDEVLVITSNVWNDDNQQQVRNIRNSSRKDGILRDDFEENVWADVQIVSSIPGSLFSATELSNDIAQSEDHKTPLTLHENVGQSAQETLRNQGLLTLHSPTLPNMENVPLFSSTKENVEPRNRSPYKDKTINYKGYASEIDQMDHFNADTSFALSIKSSFDDPLTKSTNDNESSTYNANVDRCEDLIIENKKMDGNISSELHVLIDSAGYSYIKDTKISGQEVDHERNLARIENVQNDIMHRDIINDNDDFEVLTNHRKNHLGLAINFDHLGSFSDMASLWIAVLDMLDNSKMIGRSVDEMSPSIEELAYSAQESLDARLTWKSVIETWNYKDGAGFSWWGSQIQSSYLESILSIYRIKSANQLPASELFGDNTTHSSTSITSSDQISNTATIIDDSLPEDDVKQDDSDLSENLIEFNQHSSVSASEFSLLDCIDSQTANLSIAPASPQKSDIIFDFEELIGLDFTNFTTEHPSLTEKIDGPIKLQESPDQFQTFIEFANGNMDSHSSLHLYDHETNSSFTSISSDFGEFISAENVQTVSDRSSILFGFEEMALSVNDDDSTLKQVTYNNSPESTSQQDTWMSLSDLSFLEHITISSRKPHQDLLLDFNNFISLKSTAK